MEKNTIYTEDECRIRIASLTEKDFEVFEHIGDISSDPMQYDFFAFVLCMRGRATCKVGDREIEINRNDALLISPRLFIKNTMTSVDFKCCGFLMSSSLLHSIIQLGGNLIDMKHTLSENPVIRLTEEEAQRCLNNFEFCFYKLKQPHTPHHKEILQLLIQSMAYEFIDLIQPKLQVHIDRYTYTAPEMIFKRFVSLAVTDTPVHRDIKYYADKLCITPKYLSSVCKQQSDKTASEILNNLAIDQIKQMLRTTDKSVKEIASEAGFENLSFFGKYVRRALGVSPREYRLKPQE